jgi:hypothetical protein
MFMDEKKLFPVFLKTAALFAFFLSLFAAAFYAAGTAQEFTDETQFFLLRILSALGLFLAFVSVYGTAYNGFRFFSFSGELKRRKSAAENGKFRFLPGICLYLILGAFGILLAVFASFVSVTAGGNA